MQVHSTSLESVSTVHIEKLNGQSRSSSVDDILNVNSIPTNQNNSLSKVCDDCSIMVDASLDSRSVSCDGDSPKARGFTQSLPAEIERKISIGSKVTDLRRETDCFSDNFTVTQVYRTVSACRGWGRMWRGVHNIVRLLFSVTSNLVF